MRIKQDCLIFLSAFEALLLQCAPCSGVTFIDVVQMSLAGSVFQVNPMEKGGGSFHEKNYIIEILFCELNRENNKAYIAFCFHIPFTALTNQNVLELKCLLPNRNNFKNVFLVIKHCANKSSHYTSLHIYCCKV